MTSYPRAGTTQMLLTPPNGGQSYWLGAQGLTTGIKYSTVYSGGPEKASVTLFKPARFRAEWMVTDSRVQLYRGGARIWDGNLDLPQPGVGQWTLTAAGVGVQGADFAAVYTDPWPTSEPDEVVNNAIGRGLPWVNPGIGSPSGIWLGQAPDSGSSYVNDVLNSACTRGGLGWYVNSFNGGAIGNVLSVAALPATPTRLLVAVNPVPRTNGGDVSLIWIRYQSSADSTSTSTPAVYSLTSVTNTGHSGGREQYLDLSNAGTMTQAAAQAVGNQILKIYQSSSFTSPFTFQYGSLLTMSGVPVDPGMEQAGFVCQLVLADFAYGGGLLPPGPIQFIAGVYEWDDDALQGSITPYQMVDQSISGLLSQTAQSMSVTSS
jgi:hypothetical protein